MALTAGTRLGPYEVLSPLGAGGMGEVYKARDPRLARDVAIKVLPASFSADPDRLRRFEQEARAAGVLNHPNITAVYDFGQHEGAPYVVMELLEGETLRSRLNTGPVPLRPLADYALQVTSGLSAAHAKEIVHRDLKPENLFITKAGHLKILDFGLAKQVHEVAPGEETIASTASQHTMPGTVVGTLSYMSPEQVKGLPADHRSDLFSLGGVLYEMATGERLFQGNSAIAVTDAILHAEPRDLGERHLPGKLKSIIRRLVEKDPAKRYASAEEVHAELRELEASLAPTRLAALPRSVWIALGTAVVIAAAIGSWLWQRASRARWALETATPEVTRLVAAGDFGKAATLAREARAVLPKDPTLEKLWTEATVEVSVKSDPSGAEVSMRPYQSDGDIWENLGRTPLQKIRVPRSAVSRNFNDYVWRIAKPGFATVSRIGMGRASVFRLAPAKSVPPGMVPVSGGEFGVEIPGLALPDVPLDDYFIDRHEVTNEEYKKFVDAGGYQKRDFWRQPFIRDGRALSWEDAVALFRDTTGRPGPATWEIGGYPRGLEKHPVAGVSWYEAAAYAEFAGKSLPTIYHWTRAAQELFAMLIVPGSNFAGAGTVSVEGRGALSGWGTTDMAGNVKEWCWNESGEGKRLILGGGFGEALYMFTDADAQSPWDRKPNYGFRCTKVISPPPATTARVVPAFRDFLKEKPASDEVFKAFKGMYAYDKTELDARLEETKTAEDWTREKVSFRAAYGGERVIAYLYLPKNAAPPFQTIVFFPGSEAIFLDRFDDGGSPNFAFVLKSGRALMFPIYKSTFERRDGLKSDYPAPTALWRDHMIAWSKDLGRSLDYLETRKDVDRTKLAYLGVSWGATLGPVLLADEERFKAAILAAGGITPQQALSEADAINFVTRVKIPVLMVSGRYDNFLPLESSQLPLFRLLGTPEADKRHIVYDAGHVVIGRSDLIRDSLDWLDKYLGPVKR